MATAAMMRFEEEKQACHSEEHSKQLLSRLAQFWEHDRFCDVTLMVEDIPFKVHRVILAGCSDYFEAMFSHNMMERRMEEVRIPSMCLRGFRPLLHYIYTGELLLTPANVYDIVPVASFLQMTSALKLISLFLKSKLTFDNAEQLLALCDSHGLVELQQIYRAMVLKDFMEFAETEQFLELRPDALISYLCEDSLHTPSELALLQRVLCWYNYDRDGREEHMPEVLDRIRFTQDGWDTIDFAAELPPFTTNRECREMLAWCRRYMQNPSSKHLLQSYRTRVRYDQKTLIQMGGVHLQRAEPFLGFEVHREFDPAVPDEKSGYSRNHYYHRKLNRWMPMGPIECSDARSHNPLVEVNGFVIMVGGYIYTTDFNLATYQHCSDEVKLVDAGGFAMWDLAFLHESRAHHVAVHLAGYVYALGGKTEGGVSSSAERYSLDEDEWIFIEPLPYPVYDHAGTVYSGQVYISGGVVRSETSRQVWSYHPQHNEWSQEPPLLTARWGHCMEAVDGKLLVCGGSTGSRCLASLERFCEETQQWTYLTPMRQDCSGITSVVLEMQMLIVGGENSVGDLLTQVQQYNPQTDSWSTFAALPTAMKNVGCCAVTVKPGDPNHSVSSSGGLTYQKYNSVSDEDYVEVENEDELEDFTEWKRDEEWKGDTEWGQC